jgi:hypothetical protein
VLIVQAVLIVHAQSSRTVSVARARLRAQRGGQGMLVTRSRREIVAAENGGSAEGEPAP